ncbi:hypothetical protein ACQ1Q5_05135 [Ornithobacterium rhinotracheale]
MNTKRFLILLLLFSFVLPLTSCKDEDDPIIKEKVDKFAVEIEEVNKTASTCEIKISPSDESTPYVTVVLPRDVYVAFSKENLSEKALAQMNSEAKKQNLNIGAYLNSIQKKGEQTVTLNALNPNTVYTVLIFKREGDKISKNIKNQKFYFSTMVADIKKVDFKGTAEINGLDVTLKIEPSDKEIGYYVVSLKKQIYDEAKKNGISDQEILISNLKHKIYQSIRTEDELPEALKRILNKGNKTFKISGLDPETEYIYLASGFSVPDVYTFFPNTNISSGTFTTGKSNLKKYKFNLNYELLADGSKVKVSFSPEDEEEVYMWRYQTVDETTRNLDADALAKKIMSNTMMIGPWDRNQGKKEHTVPVEKGQEYYIIVFGISGRNITTHAEMVKFRTGEAVDPSTLEIESTINHKTPYTANITFQPNDKNIYYAMGLIEDDKTTEDEIKSQFQKDIEEGFKDFAKVNKGVNMLTYINTFYFHGRQPFEFSNLTPNTSYTLFTFAISNEGKVVKVESKKSFVRTSQIQQDIKLVPELYGVFDGNKADSTMVTNPEQVRGKAIIVLKYDFQNADKGAAYMVPETFRKIESDREKMPDSEVLARLKNLFRSVDKSTPYGFYMAEWNQAQVSITYGYKNDGTMGLIDRVKIVTTDRNQVTDIQKLKEITSSKESSDKNAVIKYDKDVLKNIKKLNFSKFAKKKGIIKPVSKSYKLNVREAVRKASKNENPESINIENFDFFRVLK